MDSKNQMNSKEQPEKLENPIEEPTSKTNRRRFVRGVAAAVPVILTVKSRSALATVGCLSPSASASINLLHSRPNRERDGVCLGRTPGYWKNAAKTHGDLLARSMLFGNIYAGGFPGKSMEQVMKLDGNDDPYQLGAHLAAAWCNLRKGWVSPSVLNLSDLQAMWAGRYNGYAPVAGVNWYAENIVAYLQTTMTL